MVMRKSLCPSKSRETSYSLTFMKYFKFEIIMLLKSVNKDCGGKNKSTDTNEAEM